MYRCKSCGTTMEYPHERCPNCGVLISEVECEKCGYTDEKNVFIKNNHRCPKCGFHISMEIDCNKYVVKYLNICNECGYLFFEAEKPKSLIKRLLKWRFAKPATFVFLLTLSSFTGITIPSLILSIIHPVILVSFLKDSDVKWIRKKCGIESAIYFLYAKKRYVCPKCESSKWHLISINELRSPEEEQWAIREIENRNKPRGIAGEMFSLGGMEFYLSVSSLVFLFIGIVALMLPSYFKLLGLVIVISALYNLYCIKTGNGIMKFIVLHQSRYGLKD